MGRKPTRTSTIAFRKTEQAETVGEQRLKNIFIALLKSGMFRGTGDITDSSFTLLVQPYSPDYVPTKIHVAMDKEGKFRFEIDINNKKPWIGSKFMDVSPEDATNKLTEFLVSRIVSSWRLGRRTTGRLNPVTKK